MIVVDTSAIIAVLLAEEGYGEISRRLMSDAERVVSPMSFVESVMVLSRTFSEPKQIVESYLQRAGIAQCVVDADQTRWAADAFLLYGKGRHPARLNLGDCFSYAAAKALDAPLLYVGGDFGLTDVKTA